MNNNSLDDYFVKNKSKFKSISNYKTNASDKNSNACIVPNKMQEEDILTVERECADGNISSIYECMDSIRAVIDVVFNSEVEFIVDGDDKDVTIPCIVYSLVERKLNKKTPLGSTKINTIKEVIDGKETGDHYKVESSFYDCIVEFYILGRTKRQAIEIQEKLEESLEIYSSYIKKAGVVNIRFIKEFFKEDKKFKGKKYPNCAISFYIELQKIKLTRLSSLKSVGISIENKLKKDKPYIVKVFDELSSNNNLLN